MRTVLGIVLFLALVVLVIFVLAYAIMKLWKLGGRARKTRRDRNVEWAPYCRPENEDTPEYFRVGVERRTEDGRVLNDVYMRTVEIDDDLHRMAAQEDAKFRAEVYNRDRVGM